MSPSGHNWVQGQGKGERLKEDDEEEEKCMCSSSYSDRDLFRHFNLYLLTIPAI
jgi:hypothetical protein